MGSSGRYPRLALFVGATGTGKSALAELAAERSGAPIVVLDRFQVFAELSIGTGRNASPGRSGVRRHFLEDRSVAAGELSARQALARTHEVLRILGPEHPEIILEGGSTSLLDLLTHDADITAAITRVTMVDLAPDQHIGAIVERAHGMLVATGPSMLDEADRAWRSAPNWSFVSAICGYDAIAAVCEEAGCSPGAVPPEVIAARVFPRLVATHLAYAARQRYAFGKLFPRAMRSAPTLAAVAP